MKWVLIGLGVLAILFVAFVVWINVVFRGPDPH